MMNRLLMLLLALLITQSAVLAQTPPRPTPEATPESTTAIALGAPVTDLEGSFEVRLPLDWLAQPYARRIYFGTSPEAVAIEQTVPDTLSAGEIGGFVTVATVDAWQAFIDIQTANNPAEATPDATASESAQVRPVEVLLAVQASYGNLFDQPEFDAPLVFTLDAEAGGQGAFMLGTARGGDVAVYAVPLADDRIALVAFTGARGQLDPLDPVLLAIIASVEPVA
ncbi:MAG: hypothetical protein SF029_10010 [bacterium]|nr:hypothetical protein [bacterium]